MDDKTIRTAGQLRGATAHAPAVCPVKVWVYLPGHRGPVACYVARYALKETGNGEGNTFNLYMRPVPTDEPEPTALHPEPAEPNDPLAPATSPELAAALAGYVAELDAPKVSIAVTALAESDKGAAGAKTERVPNSGEQ